MGDHGVRGVIAQCEQSSLDLDAGMLQGVVNDLKQLPSDNKREALTEYLMKSERGVTMLSPHADLKKN